MPWTPVAETGETWTAVPATAPLPTPWDDALFWDDSQFWIDIAADSIWNGVAVTAETWTPA